MSNRNELSEREKEIVTAVMAEKSIRVMGLLFLIFPVNGEKMPMLATPELYASWTDEVVAESIRRVDAEEMKGTAA
jgi:hypothetical protein